MSDAETPAAAPEAPNVPEPLGAGGDANTAAESRIAEDKPKRRRNRKSAGRARAALKAAAEVAAAEASGTEAPADPADPPADAAPAEEPKQDGVADAAPEEPKPEEKTETKPDDDEPADEAAWRREYRKKRLDLEFQKREAKRQEKAAAARAEAALREAEAARDEARALVELAKKTPRDFLKEHGVSLREAFEGELDAEQDPTTLALSELQAANAALEEKLNGLLEQRQTQDVQQGIAAKKAEIAQAYASAEADDLPYLSTYDPAEVADEAFSVQAQYYQQNKHELPWEDVFGIIEEHLRAEDERRAPARARGQGQAESPQPSPVGTTGTQKAPKPSETTVTRRAERGSNGESPRPKRRQKAYDYIRAARTN